MQEEEKMRSLERLLLLFATGWILCTVIWLAGAPLYAINEEKEFVPRETYHYLFFTGLEIIRTNMPLELIESVAPLNETRPYSISPRLKWFSRPRSTEYTTFTSDGYFNETFVGDPLRTKKIPGKWTFTVRWKHDWTTRAGTYYGVIEFCEVMPEIFFDRCDATLERKQFLIAQRFPDPKIHKIKVLYTGARFDINTQRSNLNQFAK